MDVSLLVELVDDESEDEADIPGVVVGQVDDPSTREDGS